MSSNVGGIRSSPKPIELSNLTASAFEHSHVNATFFSFGSYRRDSLQSSNRHVFSKA
jgi:hypothetical protein